MDKSELPTGSFQRATIPFASPKGREDLEAFLRGAASVIGAHKVQISFRETSEHYVGEPDQRIGEKNGIISRQASGLFYPGTEMMKRNIAGLHFSAYRDDDKLRGEEEYTIFDGIRFDYIAGADEVHELPKAQVEYWDKVRAIES